MAWLSKDEKLKVIELLYGRSTKGGAMKGQYFVNFGDTLILREVIALRANIAEKALYRKLVKAIR